MKTYIKSKSAPNAAGPKYRTPDHFKASIFSQGKPTVGKPTIKFNPAVFKTQHKG